MNQITEDKDIKDIIDELISKGIYKLPKETLLTEENTFKLEIMKMICLQNNGDEELQINNLKMLPLNSELQRNVFLFFIYLKNNSIKEMILGMDVISDNYNQLKNEEKFKQYLNKRKMKMIPFLTMIDFIAFVNFGKEISSKIKEFSKKKYIKNMIIDYIEAKRSSFWRIIFLYNNLVLHGYDDNNIENNELLNKITLNDLKILFRRYICFNDLLDIGEIVNFTNCLNKSITCELNSIHLKYGPDKNLINNMINFIFKEICSRFCNKGYFVRTSLNELYDFLAQTILTLSEDSIEDNYAKFVINYCQFHKQGNKNIVFSFLTGLNPCHFKETFNKIEFDDIKYNDEDYYNNISSLFDKIIPKKKSKKKSGLLYSEENKINNIEENRINTIEENENKINIIEENEINIRREKKEKEKNNKINENIENNKIVNYKIESNYISINSKEKANKIDINKDNDNKKDNSEKDKNTNYEETIKKMNIKIAKLEEEMEENKKEKKQMKEKIEENKKENKQMKEKMEKNQKENKQIIEKLFNSNSQIKMELYKLKNEIKRINYRDISKLIINKYIEKYQKQINNKKDLKNKKEKAFYICKLLERKEATYFEKIINKYYDSNANSHISAIFDEYGKKCIVGSSYNEKYVIENVYEDYCDKIFEEEIKDKTFIEKWFGLKDIVGHLYDKYILNQYSS